ncbi:Aste57867_22087 [Aphanomyces stellatus]|uniref:Aste57867_22087 protein n=1 Tax=Aphanomyces stellatus TaxID=120398 RepID=A0A485LJY3_9STRA|nr:hypothetical protein As57867_022018 [Aphanomyces stellatus]VFT98755.1 Aste57867_22087 [Aphanomyces stellatus]
MNPSRLNILTKRQNEAYLARLQRQYSSPRGTIAFVLMAALLLILPYFGSSTLGLLFIVLPGYAVALISALVVLKSLYVAVVKQWSALQWQGRPCFRFLGIVVIVVVGACRRKQRLRRRPPPRIPFPRGCVSVNVLVVPEAVDIPRTASASHRHAALSAPIVSTDEELRAYQPRPSTVDDDVEAKLNFGFGMEMSSAINPNGLYAQTYAVMKPTAKPPARKELESALSSAPHVDKALEVLAECRLKPRHMGNLCDTLRHVLAQHLQDVLGNLTQNMDELMKMGLRRDLLVDFSAVQPVLSIQVPGEQAPRTLRNVSMKMLLNMCRAEPVFASKTRPNVHLLREYETLMKYFDVKEEYSTAYAIQRLQTLGEDGFLGPYRWDSGGKWKGKPWTKESLLPSDAELIMNLFCAMLDDVLPATCDTDRPFRRAHYAPSPPTKSASIRGMFLIFCSQSMPPNFKVIANGTVWEIVPGKTNVFQAIVLFLHAVKQFKSGHLGNINLHVLLEEIFET